MPSFNAIPPFKTKSMLFKISLEGISFNRKPEAPLSIISEIMLISARLLNPITFIFGFSDLIILHTSKPLMSGREMSKSTIST
ncbi:Uncharacterised protein [Mycobacterium tuberculosis]|nr:Uncharacterised protein [Mycobacterium tuberculosis]